MRGSLVKIKRGIELAKKGKFEQASKIYDSIKGTKIEDKSKFDILKKQIMEHEHTEKLKLKNKVKEHLNDALERKDYKSAIVHYKKAKKVYRKITDKSLHELLLKTHKRIVTEHNVTGSEKLEKGISEIEDLIKVCYGALKDGQNGKAVSYYKEIKDLKSKLPSGFSKQKKSLVSDILKLHKEVISSKGEIGETVDEINKLIEKIEILLHKNKDAHEEYNKIMGLYSTLSPDYLESDNSLSKRIKSLGDRVTKSKLKSDKKIISTIKDKIASVLRRVKGNRQKYNELVTLYTKMPKGADKKQAKKTVLKAYTNHVLENDDEHIEEYGNDVKKKYKDLLKFVVDFHHSIENGLFEDLSGQVKQIKKIFDKLPVGLARGNAKLVNDVKKISLEADLYSRVLKLKKLSGDKLKKSLDSIYVDVKRLERNSHDAPLFDYIKSICGQYSLDMISLTEEKVMRKHIEEAEQHEAEIESEKKFLSEDVPEKHWYNVLSWFRNDKIEAPSLPEADELPNIPKPIAVDEDDVVNTMTKRDLNKIERVRVISNKRLKVLATKLARQEKSLDDRLEHNLNHVTNALEKVRMKSMYSELERVKELGNEELRAAKRRINKMEDARVRSNKKLYSKALAYAEQEDKLHSNLMKDAHFIEMARRKSLASEISRVKGLSSKELGKAQRDLDKIEKARLESNSRFSSKASGYAKQEDISDEKFAIDSFEDAQENEFVFDSEEKVMKKAHAMNRPISSLKKRVDYNEKMKKILERDLGKIEEVRLKSNRGFSSRAAAYARQEDKADLAVAKQEKKDIEKIEHVRQLSNARLRSMLRKIEKEYPDENPELIRLQEVERKINSELEKLPSVHWSESDTHSIVSDMPDFSVEIGSKRTVSLPLDKVSAYRKRLEIVKRKIDEETRGFS